MKIILTYIIWVWYNNKNTPHISISLSKKQQREDLTMNKEQATTANGKRPFGIRDSLAYAAGDLGCNMSFALKGTMALFWTQVMGMSAWYSLLLVIVQFWDAINDPLIGSMIDADQHRYKRNKFLQYIWIGSLGLIVGGACCFLFPVPPFGRNSLSSLRDM